MPVIFANYFVVVLFTDLDGTSVGVGPALEELLEEGLVEVVDGVVEGEEDELGDVLLAEAAGDVGASAVAVGQLAVAGVTAVGALLTRHEGGHRGQQAEAQQAVETHSEGTGKGKFDWILLLFAFSFLFV